MNERLDRRFLTLAAGLLAMVGAMIAGLFGGPASGAVLARVAVTMPPAITSGRGGTVDARASLGPGGRKPVGVRVSPPAPMQTRYLILAALVTGLLIVIAGAVWFGSL